MKLLIVNTTPSSFNGITNVIFNLTKAIDRKDLQIGYVAVSEIADNYKTTLDELGIPYYILNRSIRNPLLYIKRLASLAKGYDIIHVHGNSATMVLEMVAAKFAGVTLRCAHSHNTTCNMKTIDKLMRPLFNMLCNGRLACGLEAGKWLHGEREFLVVNNGVDTDRFKFDPDARSRIRSELGWDNNIVLANIANFVEAKNHTFLIDIFHKLTIKNDMVRLLLIGTGPLMDKAVKQAESLHVLDKIHFAGSVPNVNEYLSAIDLIVMPSKFEGLPLSLVEEQANGLRAVISDAITKDVDMTGHLKFIPLSESHESWADSILKELEEGIERTESHSKDSIEMIKEAGYDIKNAAKELKNFFRTKLQEING